MVQFVRTLCVLFALASTASAAGLRDETSHAPPQLALPRAGGSYTDPVFGTRVIRVTDERSGEMCVHAYSYWPALNLDATRLLLACDNVPLLYRFDGQSVVADGRLTGSDGPDVQFEGASWSNLSPDVIYALDGTKLWRLDVSRRGAAGARVVRDFSGLFSYPFTLTQLSMSSDDRVFSFHSRDPQSGARLDAVAFDAATGKVRIFPRGDFLMDESKIAKNGRWIMVDGKLGGFKMWEPESGDVLSFEDGDADARPGGHADLGRELFVNSDGWETGLIVRGYAAPLGASNLHNIVHYRRKDGSRNWTLADHVSLRADAETFVVASTYAGDGSYSAFEDEIYLAYTDGSGFVRLAHTRSTEANPDRAKRYWAQPRATVDRAGRWVVWTSDLGSTSRTDVLMLEIPAELRPKATTPTTPSTPSTPPPDPPTPGVDDPSTPAAPDDDGAPIATVGGAPDDGVDALTSGCAAGGATRGAGAWAWLLVVGLLVSSRRRGATGSRSH